MKAINFFKTSNIWIVFQYFLQCNSERSNKMYKLLYYIMLCLLPWLLILSCVANPVHLLWQIETFHSVPMFVQECSIASLKMIFHHLLFHLPQQCFHAYEPIFYSLQFSQDSGKDKIKTHYTAAAASRVWKCVCVQCVVYKHSVYYTLCTHLFVPNLYTHYSPVQCRPCMHHCIGSIESKCFVYKTIKGVPS